MVEVSRIDRARGIMLGAAVGDALGAPLEGLCAQQIRRHYGTVDDYVDGSLAWKKKPYRWRLPGLYSDDTQQALALADVLLACGRVDPDRLAEIYLELATPPGSFVGAHRGVGRSFRQVLELLRNNTPPLAAGQISAGAGAAMRIAPVALYFGDDETAMVDAVLTASLMTHRDCRSLMGAVAVAHAIRLLSHGQKRSPSLLFTLAGEVYRAEQALIARTDGYVLGMETHPHSLSTAIVHVERVLDIPHRDRALVALVEEANHHGPAEICRRPTMGFTPALIPTCLYLLLSTDSFEDAVTEAVNLGGDADTAGTILGAMAGAHYGAEEIPQRWLDRLQNREGIALRAEALASHSAEGLNIPDLIATERRLSELEATCREELLTTRQNPGDLGANRRL